MMKLTEWTEKIHASGNEEAEPLILLFEEGSEFEDNTIKTFGGSQRAMIRCEVSAIGTPRKYTLAGYYWGEIDTEEGERPTITIIEWDGDGNTSGTDIYTAETIEEPTRIEVPFELKSTTRKFRIDLRHWDVDGVAQTSYARLHLFEEGEEIELPPLDSVTPDPEPDPDPSPDPDPNPDPSPEPEPDPEPEPTPVEPTPKLKRIMLETPLIDGDVLIVEVLDANNPRTRLFYELPLTPPNPLSEENPD